MANNPNEEQDLPAFPIVLQGAVIECGLTKRELFAAMAMQGILASEQPEDTFIAATVATRALAYTDALLSALDRLNNGEQR